MLRSHLDARDARSGLVVSDKHGYYDSQNIVRGGDAPGCYSVILHHCFGHEGGGGLRLYSSFTEDGGRTWSDLVAVEPSLTRVSNDGYQLVHPQDPSRVFVFYSHGPNCGSYTCPDTGRRLTLPRADMQLAEGYYVKTSGDGGRTWSRDTAACVPVRRTRIDRANPWGGENIGFFCCDKPTVVAGSMVYMAFQKTREGGGETPGSEAFFLRSKDFLRVADPAAATWETLPGGDLGLAAADTRLLLGEEPHILQVDNFGRGDGGDGGDGGNGAAVVEGREAGAGQEPRMWCVWRTETGRLANSYSSDGGVSWDKMSWMTFSGKSTGRPFRNPRGAITPYRFLQDGPDGFGRFAILWYNNGHTARDGYVAREVLWMALGRATTEGVIEWGQPEIVQYWDSEKMASRPGWNADWAIVDGPGYCDFVEPVEGGLQFVASNKITVRLSTVEPRLLGLMHNQWTSATFPGEGVVVAHQLGRREARGQALEGEGEARVWRCRAPVLPDLRSRGGFTFLLWVVCEGSGNGGFRGDEGDLGLGRRFFRPGSRVAWGKEEYSSALDENLTDQSVCKGFSVTTAGLNAGPARLGGLKLHVTNGFGAEFTVSTDARGTSNLCDGAPHLVGFVADGGAGVASCMVDGLLCDGLPAVVDGDDAVFVPPKEGDYEGDALQGWLHINRALGELGGSQIDLHAEFGVGAGVVGAGVGAGVDAGADAAGGIGSVRLLPGVPAEAGEAGRLLEFLEYDRALTSSEMVAAWKAGPGAFEAFPSARL